MLTKVNRYNYNNINTFSNISIADNIILNVYNLHDTH